MRESAQPILTPGPEPHSNQMSRAYLHSYNLPSSGVALEGYCPVAYFEADKAIRGYPQFASTHNDVTYHFVSADAKRLFEQNPERFLPAYGGWCAFGMAADQYFPVDPTLYKIVDGRVFLFLQNDEANALELWNSKDEAEFTQKADAFWAKENAK